MHSNAQLTPITVFPELDYANVKNGRILLLAINSPIEYSFISELLYSIRSLLSLKYIDSSILFIVKNYH